jgi:hypothetical protein
MVDGAVRPSVLVSLLIPAFAFFAACTRVPVDLLTVTDVGTVRVEEGGRFVVLGGGFPTGRDGRLVVAGELRRNGETTRVEHRRAIHATSPVSAELVVDEAFVEALHGSFVGSVELVFDGAVGMPVARGVRDGVVFDVARSATLEMQGDLERMRQASERLESLGLRVSEQESRVRIETVRAGSIAEAAGLRAGDVIKSLDDSEVRSAEDFGRDTASRATNVTIAREGRGLLRFALRAGSSPKALSRTDARGVVLFALVWLALLVRTTKLGSALAPFGRAAARAERQLAVAVRRPARAVREVVPAFCVMTLGLVARAFVEIEPLTVAVVLSAVVVSVQIAMRGTSLRTTLAEAVGFLASAMACAVLAGSGSFALSSGAAHATASSPWFTSSPAHLLAAIALFASATTLRARHTGARAIFRGLGALAVLPVVLPVASMPPALSLIAGVGVVIALALFARAPQSRTRMVVALAALALAVSFGMLFVELDVAFAHDLAWATLGASAMMALAFAARLSRRFATTLVRRIRGLGAPREVATL